MKKSFFKTTVCTDWETLYQDLSDQISGEQNYFTLAVMKNYCSQKQNVLVSYSMRWDLKAYNSRCGSSFR